MRIYRKRVKALVKRTRALWYNSGGQRLLNISVVRDPSGKRRDDCFFTTNLSASPVDILETIAARWPLEVAFRDAKQLLGLEEPQNRVQKAVERTAPLAIYIYNLVVIWYVHHGVFDLAAYKEKRPWYRQKKNPSFADMLTSLREQSIRQRIIQHPATKRGSLKLIRRLARFLTMAS